MERIQVLRDSFQRVAGSGYSRKVKRGLIEGILGQLVELERSLRPSMELELNSCVKADRTCTAFTSASQITLNSTFVEKNNYCEDPLDTSDIPKQEMELKILQKQRIKCYLNQEIENQDDDHFEMQKTTLSKKDYCEELDRKIARKSYDICKNSCDKRASLDHDRKSLSARFKNFFQM